MTAAAPPAATGFYGKLPRHGDYVRRNLPGGFAPRWGDWLGACTEAARSAMGGEAFAAAWASAAAWRFRCADGLFGAWRPTGLLLPSRDAVGRLFPLTLVASTPGEAMDAAWFADLERLGGEAAAGGFDADGLGAALRPAPAGDAPMPAAAPGTIVWWRLDAEPMTMPLGPDNLLALLQWKAVSP